MLHDSHKTGIPAAWLHMPLASSKHWIGCLAPSDQSPSPCVFYLTCKRITVEAFWRYLLRTAQKSGKKKHVLLILSSSGKPWNFAGSAISPYGIACPAIWRHPILARTSHLSRLLLNRNLWVSQEHLLLPSPACCPLELLDYIFHLPLPTLSGEWSKMKPKKIMSKAMEGHQAENHGSCPKTSQSLSSPILPMLTNSRSSRFHGEISSTTLVCFSKTGCTSWTMNQSSLFVFPVQFMPIFSLT